MGATLRDATTARFTPTRDGRAGSDPDRFPPREDPFHGPVGERSQGRGRTSSQ